MYFIQIIYIVILTIYILPTAFPQRIELISKQMNGKSAGFSGSIYPFSTGIDISYDGRFVVFSSSSNNIIPGDTNHFSPDSDYNGPGPDIFLYDRKTQKTIRISAHPNGSQMENCGNFRPSISADGQVIAFDTLSDSYISENILVNNRQIQKIDWVSMSSSGEIGNNYSMSPKVSADGKSVVFQSLASNLIDDNTYKYNNYGDYFIKNLITNEIRLCSPSMDGINESHGFISYDQSSVNYDGLYVCFVSASTHLTAEKVGGGFVRDTSKEITKLVSSHTDGTPIQGGEFGIPLISDDGRYIFFNATTIPVLPPTGTVFPPGTRALIVKDLQTGEMELLPFWKNDNEVIRYAAGPVAFSATGRYVALVYDNTQLNRYDRETGELRVLLNAHFFAALAITPDGKTIAFSTDSPLVPEDDNPTYDYELHRGGFDVYVMELDNNPSSVAKWEEHP